MRKSPWSHSMRTTGLTSQRSTLRKKPAYLPAACVRGPVGRRLSEAWLPWQTEGKGTLHRHPAECRGSEGSHGLEPAFSPPPTAGHWEESHSGEIPKIKRKTVQTKRLSRGFRPSQFTLESTVVCHLSLSMGKEEKRTYWTPQK